MGMLTPDEMMNPKPNYTVSNKQMDIIMALIDTAQRTTDLEGVYNDTCDSFYSWDEVFEMVDKLVAIKS